MPKLYSSLADWWALLSPPSDYAEEAAVYAQYLTGGVNQPAKTMVEFGSGGGNNASCLKQQFQMTLVDLSPQMLAVSRELNPECERVQGDMRIRPFLNAPCSIEGTAPRQARGTMPAAGPGSGRAPRRQKHHSSDIGKSVVKAPCGSKRSPRTARNVSAPRAIVT